MAVWALAALTVLVCAPLFIDGIGTFGSDWLFHLQRIDCIAESLRQGQFPVRLYTNAKDGYGYASSLFYGEAFLYFPALLRLAGMSVQGAFRIFCLGMNFLTGWIAYYSFGVMLRSRKTALVSAALYMLASYRIFNVYWRAAVGEYTAMAFLPLLAAALWLLYGRLQPEKRQLALACRLLIISFTALLQSHMITTALAGLWCAVLCVWNWRTTFTKPVLLTWVKAAGVSVLLNLWFLVPFFTVMGTGLYMGTGEAGAQIQRTGHTLADLLFWGESHTTIGLPLLAGAGIFVACCLYFGDRMPKAERKLGTAGVLLGGIGAILCTRVFPWDALAKLPVLGWAVGVIQFPGRYFMLATVGLLVGTACGISALARLGRHGAARGAAVLCMACALLGFSSFMTNYMNGYDGTYIGDTSRILYDGRNSSSNISLDLDTLYVPATADETRDGFETNEVVTSVTVQDVQQENGVTSVTCTEYLGQEGAVELPLLYYPGYRELTGQGTVFATANGMVGVVVPANFQGTVQVAFREPKRWRIADFVSLATAAGLVVLTVRRRRAANGTPSAAN